MLKSPVQSSVTSFWVTVEPISVKWTKGCLAAAGCADSRLTLSEWNLVSDERISSSWSIQELFDSSHMFASYWSKGRPADITFNYEVVGADPIYGFSRTCDSTRAIRVFDDKHKLVPKTADQVITSTVASSQQSDKITLNLTGKCFNAAIIVQKYESNCPWCSCGEGYAIVGQLSESESRDLLYHVNNSSETLIDIGLMALSAIAVATSAAFSCVLIAYLRERRYNCERSVASCSMKFCDNNSTIYQVHQTNSHKKRLINSEITRYQPTCDCPTLMSCQVESSHCGSTLENDVSGCRIATDDWKIESALLDGIHRYYKSSDIPSAYNGNLKI
ncbi:unnamed protein product [Onchocerca ochengi]|uniref:C2H2-type domain-containing protein n=1 Tax=Onchocerca ochengi TaxID=42157 RepID=A0A182EJQ9_ONCOC|nr:unnamed protein product [Onchocerca ochengi]